jgi:ATP-dependent Lon protease
MNNKKGLMIYQESLFEDMEETIITVPILMECDKDEDFSEGLDKVGDTIPILPLRNMVLFTGVAMPVIASRAKSIRLLRHAVQKKILLGVCCQK